MSYTAPNFSTPADWVVYANSVTSGLFWDLMLVVIFVVAFGVMLRRSTVERSFAASSFLCGILAIFLYTIGGLEEIAAVIFVALPVIGLIMLLFTKE